MKWNQFPSLTGLKAFETAARNRGYSVAGRELNVSHAAIVQQVRNLEAHLGTQLVVRSGRGIDLTDSGRLLYDHLTRGFGIISEALDELDQSQANRPVNITMTPAFASNWFIPRMERFKSAHPDIGLSINPTTELVNVSAGECDLAIRFGVGEWKGLDSEPLVPTNYVLAGARSLVGERWKGGPEDLSKLPWLEEAGSRESAIWLERLGVEPPSPELVTGLPGSVLMKPLLDGLGIAVTARALIQDYIDEGELVVLLEGDPDAHTAYHMVWRKGVQRPALKAVISWLRKVARQDAG